MFDELRKYFSQIFFYGISLDISSKPGDDAIRLKLKDMLIKDEETGGIILESFILSVYNFNATENMEKSAEDASYVVEKCILLVSEDWINRIIAGDEALKKLGAKNVRIDFTPDRLTLSGEFKVGVNVKASVSLKLSADGGRLRIDLDRITALDAISLPGFAQKAIFSVIQKYFTQKLPKGVKILERGVLIDHLAMIPYDVHFDLTNIIMDDDNLVIQGGVDREAAKAKVEERIRIRGQKEMQDQEELEKERSQSNDAESREVLPPSSELNSPVGA